MDQKSQIIEKIKASPFRPYEKQIVDLLRPAIRVFADDSKELAFAQSKIGGNPDLPKHWNWPSNKSLDFILQINLSEVKIYDLENLLPPSGWLYFFAEDYMTGKEGSAVLYYDGDKESLETKQNPNHPISPGILLGFETYYTLPRDRLTDFNNPLMPESELEEDYPEPYDNENTGGDLDGIFDVFAYEIGQYGPFSHLLGHLESLQSYEIDAQDQLLMQLILLEHEGTVYFFISQQALKEKRFNEAKLVAEFS